MGKKLFALSLCLVLAAALFAGCWNSSSSSAPSSKPSSSSAPSSSMLPDSSMANSGAMDESLPEGTLPNSGTNSMPGSGTTDNSLSGSAANGTNGSSAAAPAAAPFSSSWQLRLVNAQNPLPENFTVQTVAIKGYENRLFDARAASALEQLLFDAQAAGCKLYLVSAYRSVDRQTALFRRKTQSFMAEGFPQAEAEKQAAAWVARPGTSEHNLGLAADIVSSDWYKTNSDLTEAFEQTPHFAWLQKNAARYGFVLRYPKNKQSITGVAYEPWHYRYVGVEAATEMTQKGLTLEEYCHKTA